MIKDGIVIRSGARKLLSLGSKNEYLSRQITRILSGQIADRREYPRSEKRLQNLQAEKLRFLRAQSGKSRIEAKRIWELKGRQVTIADGSSIWQYTRSTKTYTQRPFTPLAQSSELARADEIGAIVQALAADSNPRVAKTVRDAELKTKKGTFPCYLIKARLYVNEDLFWIDKTTHLLLKAQHNRPASYDNTPFVQRQEYTYSHINESFPDSLFTFTPGKSTQRTATSKRNLDISSVIQVGLGFEGSLGFSGRLPPLASAVVIGPFGFGFVDVTDKIAPLLTVSRLQGNAIQPQQLEGKVLLLTFWQAA